jgi:hypothetical protein
MKEEPSSSETSVLTRAHSVTSQKTQFFRQDVAAEYFQLRKENRIWCSKLQLLSEDLIKILMNYNSMSEQAIKIKYWSKMLFHAENKKIKA